MRRARVYLTTGLAVVALGGCGGGTTKTETVTEPPAAPDPAPSSGVTEGFGSDTSGKVGSTLTSTDEFVDPPTSIAVKLADYKRGIQPDDPSLAQSLLEGRKSSYEWVRLEVRAKNVGDGKTTLIGPDFAAITSNGDRYKGEDVDPGGVFEPDANGLDLLPGDRGHGFVAIAVPPSARITRIRYAQVGSEGPVEWKVSG